MQNTSKPTSRTNNRSNDKNILKVPLPIINKQATSAKTDTEIGEWRISLNDFNIIFGQFNNLPNPNTTTVKVFLSSTFSDFKCERNILYEISFPKIKDFCATLDLDFQFVDMRWGVTDEQSNQHTTEALCLQEIDSCKRISAGPNFVCFIGDRYGSRSLPTQIDKTEFEILLETINKNSLDSKGYSKKWYKLDENNVPPLYVLLGVYEVLNEEKCNDTMNNLMKNQLLIKLKTEIYDLQEIIQESAVISFSKGLISEAQKDAYFIAVTEKEIKHSLIDNVIRRELCILREFDDIDLSDPKVDKFSDIINDNVTNKPKIDELANKNLKSLKAFIDENVQVAHRYNIKWKSGGLDTNNSEHQDYLKQFAENFTEFLIDLIKKHHDKYVHSSRLNISLTKIPQVSVKLLHQNMHGKITGTQIDMESLFKEVIHHSKFCESKLKMFTSRDDVLDKVKSHIRSKYRNKPLCLNAASGGGKTSIMAMIAQKLSKGEFNDSNIEFHHSIVLTRFLGTSAASYNIAEMIKSVCHQIEVIFNEVEMKHQSNSSTETSQHTHENSLSDVLKNISAKISNTNRPTSEIKFASKSKTAPIQRKQLFILLDSIDQLNNKDGAFNLNWLPITLPPNIYIIFSCITNYENILVNYRSRLKDLSRRRFFEEIQENTIIELSNLDNNFCESMIKCYLNDKKRTLNTSQFDKLMKLAVESQSTLYIKLMLDRAITWRSFNNNIEDYIHTQEEAILFLFKELEANYGVEVVSYSIGYLTVSYNGLSDVEMEDLLSVNDTVLNIVYEYHDPPVKGTIHIPSVIWSRIKYELKEYLVEKQVHSKTVNYWYHRKFREVAFEHYCSDKQRFIELNSHLALIYMCDKHYLKTITLEKRSNLVIEDANRLITVQLTTHQNLRKLDVLPFYLINSRNFHDLNKECFCNLKFLICIVLAFSYEKLLNNFMDCLNVIKTISDRTDLEIEFQQIQMVYEFIVFNEKPIRMDPYQLITLVIGQLNVRNLNQNFKHILKLIQDAHENCSDNNFSSDIDLSLKRLTLRPLYNCLPWTNGPIKWYCDGFNKILCTSYHKSRIVALKFTSLPQLNNSDKVIEVIGYGKHQFVYIINFREHKVSELKINSNLNIMQCRLMLFSENRNNLFILYDKLLTIYNTERLTQICDINILWTQNSYLNETLLIYQDENHFLTANTERLTVRSVKGAFTSSNTEFTKNIASNKYTSKIGVSWDIRSIKLPNKNPKRCKVVILEYELIPKFEVNKTHQQHITEAQTSEIVVVFSQESDHVSEFNIFLTWEEGFKLIKDFTIQSHIYAATAKNECCLKYEKDKLIIGLVNGIINLFDISTLKIITSIQIPLKKDNTKINRLKLLKKESLNMVSNKDILVVSTLSNVIYFIDINDSGDHLNDFEFHIENDLISNYCQTWELSDDAKYLVVSHLIGTIDVYMLNRDSKKSFTYLKMCQLHLSLKPITNFLFINDIISNSESTETKTLAVTSEDQILNYIDLDILINLRHTQWKAINLKQNQNNKAQFIDDIDSEFSKMIFGIKKFLLTFNSDETESLVLDYKSLTEESKNENICLFLNNCFKLKFGLFIFDDRYLIGYSFQNLQLLSIWNCSDGNQLAEPILSLNENEYVIAICVSSDYSILYVLTNIRQILMNLKLENEFTCSFEHELYLTPELTIMNYIQNLKGSLEKQELETYFTKDNSAIIIQLPIISKLDSGFNLCAFIINQKYFTNICIDSTVKAKLKSFHSFCLSSSQILCISRGSLLSWKILGPVLTNTKQQIINANDIEINTANYFSFANFSTFLKHSIRLYDDFPNIVDIKKIEVSASACNLDGSVICTADRSGYLIFWYRVPKLSDGIHLVTTIDNIQYGYAIAKEHTNEVNLLEICSKSNLLFSCSKDRTIKVWNLFSANCISTIYTHLIIYKLFYDADNELLLCNARKLGNNKLLSFKVIHRTEN